jgi:Flp pilus assembly protein TadD
VLALHSTSTVASARAPATKAIAPASATEGWMLASVVVVAAALALGAWWTPIVLARQAQFGDEETVYRATLAHSPSPRACYNLGVVLLTRQRPAEAVSVYEECSRLAPSDAGVYAQLGVAYQKAGDAIRAQMAYTHALELDDADPYAWSNYASLEATLGRYDSARQKWQRALRLEPNFPPAHEGLAKLDAISRREPPPQP